MNASLRKRPLVNFIIKGVTWINLVLVSCPFLMLMLAKVMNHMQLWIICALSITINMSTDRYWLGTKYLVVWLSGQKSQISSAIFVLQEDKRTAISLFFNKVWPCTCKNEWSCLKQNFCCSTLFKILMHGYECVFENNFIENKINMKMILLQL